MTIKTFTFSPFQENTYILYDETNESVIVDAGCLFDKEKQFLKLFLEEKNLVLKRVLNTHLHLDHQFGNKFLFQTYGIKPEAGKEDEFMLKKYKNQAQLFGISNVEDAQELGDYIYDNQIIKFGNSELIALHVPGHSPGSMAFYSSKAGILFSGDVIFKNSMGRTDLEGGDYSTLIHSIKKRLLPLPDSTIVLSGHGPRTTIGYEKSNYSTIL